MVRRVMMPFLLFYFCIGTLLFPIADFSYLADLPKQYHTCASEDPDLDIADFIVEHLLNIHDNDAQEPGEKPHQVVFHHHPVQFAAVFPVISRQFISKQLTFYERKTYGLLPSIEPVPGHPLGVFRPPAPFES